jgi:uncharacterized membrane protein YgcG
VLQWCYSDVTEVLQWCYSGVTVVLQWCYSGVTAMLQWCYLRLPLVQHGNLHFRRLRRSRSRGRGRGSRGGGRNSRSGGRGSRGSRGSGCFLALVDRYHHFIIVITAVLIDNLCIE